ncbi:hypothetical protein SANA_19900 [Gottschalkiaceae bacterium SANA]|nr:hypothetical protein SANA_19900 [Gottschalkiaceae bacterium SANA]
MNALIEWLLEGDPAIVFQTHRDLLESDEEVLIKLQNQIHQSGWGAQFLSKRDTETAMWGKGAYSPKWISTTYTLLDLKNLGILPQLPAYLESSALILDRLWRLPVKSKDRYQDLCICGMLLNLCCYGGIKDQKINEMIDYTLDKQFVDGGWNCRWEVDHDHGSLHTTINVLEGLKEYIENGYSYRSQEIHQAITCAHEFILMHRLYRSDRTGKVIDHHMTMLSYPGRWKYDALRALDYFQSIDYPYDPRMSDGMKLLMKKKRKDGYWPVQQKYAGLVHFDMEQTGKASRWNTLRALRVLEQYGETFE